MESLEDHFLFIASMLPPEYHDFQNRRNATKYRLIW